MHSVQYTSLSATFFLNRPRHWTLKYLSLPTIADTIDFDPGHSPLIAYATSNWCSHLVQSSYGHALECTLARFMSSPSRRRVWLARWLLIQITAHPLQHLVKQLHS